MENENKVVEPKKKKPIALVIILILLAIGCFGCGYYFSTVDVFDDNEETQNEQAENVEKGKNEYEILVGKYMRGKPPTNCGVIEIFANDKVVTVSDITNLYAANTVTYNSPYDEDDRPDTISVEDFTKEVKKYYGENYVFNAESLVNVEGLANYKYVDGVFKKHSNNWGGTCGPSSSYGYSDAKKDGNNLEVYVYVVFNGITNDGLSDGNFYADYNRTKRVESFNWKDEDYKKGSLYKFTFKSENGNYVFISSEPVKD